MHESIVARLHEVRRVRAVMDGVCRVEIVDGELVKNDPFSADYTPEVMQLYFDDQLVHESHPHEQTVTYSLLSAT